MKTHCALVAMISALLLALGSPVHAQPGTKVFQADLEGYQETPLTLSTAGIGEFRATLNTAETELSYELTFSGLEGGTVLFAHVHLGQIATTGGVMFFLCGGGGKPACPSEGTVTGTVNASNVMGPAGQGIAPGEFAETIRAMRNGFAYANVHTATYTTGEIRGQINIHQSP